MEQTIREYLESPKWSEYLANPSNEYQKINIQQLAKNPILLDCMIAPEGYSIVQSDVTALEPNILAEFSGDPCYKEVYSSGKPHDIYMYVICKLLDNDGRISKVYNPENPTPDSVKLAKKQFKKERTIGKVFQLMSTYKAGAPKIYRNLVLNGVDITLDEVKAIRERYWGPELFGTILEYEECLLQEVQQRDGWMFNGLGRPLVVTDRKEKDVVNTFVQSTGHDCLDIMVCYLDQLVSSSEIQAVPLIEDYHDETIWLCNTEDANRMAELMKQAVIKLNDDLSYSIPIKADPEITKDFTGFKSPDPIDWYNGVNNESK